mmetsp:Transcript_23627/g.89739  ORF Transcript_23627/g.89739 Transcript_23627/m.89739 type:complete len:226 (+) Transcript_23627:975-1652(+)
MARRRTRGRAPQAGPPPLRPRTPRAPRRPPPARAASTAGATSASAPGRSSPAATSVRCAASSSWCARTAARPSAGSSGATTTQRWRASTCATSTTARPRSSLPRGTPLTPCTPPSTRAAASRTSAAPWPGSAPASTSAWLRSPTARPRSPRARRCTRARRARSSPAPATAGASGPASWSASAKRVCCVPGTSSTSWRASTTSERLRECACVLLARVPAAPSLTSS